MKQVPFDRGVLERHEDFDFGPLLPRPVDVWLPTSYQAGRSHSVLYMHDGQNLFDPADSHGDAVWAIDEAIEHLDKDSNFTAPIVVGIGNSPQRWRGFMPQKPAVSGTIRTRAARFADRPEGQLFSDAYLEFLTDQVKPFIDATYRTRPDRDNTVVMGSSMGGLISLYALEQYPNVFGGAGCVSTHWPVGRNRLVHLMGVALPRAGTHRLYFDYGTATLDAQYEPYQLRMDEYVRDAGYVRGEDWVTLKFPGADHSEHAWRERVHLPLQFLFDKE